MKNEVTVKPMCGDAKIRKLVSGIPIKWVLLFLQLNHIVREPLLRRPRVTVVGRE